MAAHAVIIALKSMNVPVQSSRLRAIIIKYQDLSWKGLTYRSKFQNSIFWIINKYIIVNDISISLLHKAIEKLND